MEWAGWFRFGAGWGACHWSARQPEAGQAGQGRGADGETAFESWTDGMGWAGKLGTVGHISAYLMILCIFDEFNESFGSDVQSSVNATFQTTRSSPTSAPRGDLL
jgi:hypothetical protein